MSIKKAGHLRILGCALLSFFSPFVNSGMEGEISNDFSERKGKMCAVFACASGFINQHTIVT